MVHMTGAPRPSRPRPPCMHVHAPCTGPELGLAACPRRARPDSSLHAGMRRHHAPPCTAMHRHAPPCAATHQSKIKVSTAASRSSNSRLPPPFVRELSSSRGWGVASERSAAAAAAAAPSALPGLVAAFARCMERQHLGLGGQAGATLGPRRRAQRSAWRGEHSTRAMRRRQAFARAASRQTRGSRRTGFWATIRSLDCE
jgi:hypothetical protein